MGCLLMKNSYGRRAVPELSYKKGGLVLLARENPDHVPLWVHCGVHCGPDTTTAHRKIIFAPLCRKETSC
jgi:hypothetical protein